MTRQELLSQSEANSARAAELSNLLVEAHKAGETETYEEYVTELRSLQQENKDVLERAEALGIAEDIHQSERRIAEALRQDDGGIVEDAPLTRDRADVTSDEREWRSCWGSEAEFMRAVRDRTLGRGDDERFHRAIGSAANTQIDSEGGFLISPQRQNEILRHIETNSVLASRARSVTLTRNSNELIVPYFDEFSRAEGSHFGGIRAYWTDEGGTTTESKPQTAEWRTRVHKLAILSTVTEELLEDAPSYESILRQAVPEEFTFKIDQAIWEGNGVKKPLGLTDTNGPIITVAKESGQAADTIVADNGFKMLQRGTPATRRRGVFYANSDTMTQWLKMASDGSNDAFYATGPFVHQSLNGQIGVFNGKPVVECEFAETVGDLNDVVFANMDGYVLVRKGGLHQAMSIHLYFDTGKQAFRFYVRVGGRPVLKQALSPLKGNNTQSDFVNLAARS